MLGKGFISDFKQTCHSTLSRAILILPKPTHPAYLKYILILSFRHCLGMKIFHKIIIHPVRPSGSVYLTLLFRCCSLRPTISLSQHPFTNTIDACSLIKPKDQVSNPPHGTEVLMITSWFLLHCNGDSGLLGCDTAS